LPFTLPHTHPSSPFFVFFLGLLLALLSIIVFSLLQDSLLYSPLLSACCLFVNTMLYVFFVLFLHKLLLYLCVTKVLYWCPSMYEFLLHRLTIKALYCCLFMHNLLMLLHAVATHYTFCFAKTFYSCLFHQSFILLFVCVWFAYVVL
jgi:hypothetical protein